MLRAMRDVDGGPSLALRLVAGLLVLGLVGLSVPLVARPVLRFVERLL